MNPIVEAENLCKTYSLGKVDIPALTNINLNIEAGEFVAISGPSGSGKTTLLNLIGLIDQPTTGRLRLQGQTVGQNGLAKLHEVRLSKIGFIFQTFNLVPVLTAFENVEYPLLLTDMPSAERERRVDEVIELVGLTEVSQHKPRELSGGQRQRVAIARALVNRPQLILADEPTANLDSQTGQAILQLMARLNREQGVTFIFSTHDPHIVGMADRVIQIHDGRIVQ